MPPGEGEPLLEMDVGVATGRVLAGHAGGKERIEYTVMGGTANLAARLQDNINMPYERQKV